MADDIRIQIQDKTGNWITIMTGVQNQDQVLKLRLDEAGKRSPTGRARAINSAGVL